MFQAIEEILGSALLSDESGDSPSTRPEGHIISTPFDFASVALFALIAVIFLHRSSKDERDPIPLWLYAVTAALCAVGDVVANHGYPIIGVIVLVLGLVGSAWIAFTPTSSSD